MAIIKQIKIGNTTYDIAPANVDTELSATSTNPVQNKAIYAAIGDVQTVIDNINTLIGE